MEKAQRRRILLVTALVVVLGLGYVGVRFYQIVGPALGWKTPRIDTVPPELPPGLEEAGLAVLDFTKTSGFRHEEAIPAMSALVAEIGARRGWAVFSTENAAVFRPESLARFDVVIGNNTTGDNWTDAQKTAFVDWIEGGGSFVGIHGAAGTRFRYWDWYTDVLLGGGRFIGHPMNPQFREATVHVEDPSHPIVSHLGTSFQHVDEWYSFEASARAAGSHVLATLDESTYGPGVENQMGEDHPIIWIACPGEGRTFYSALGHRSESYADAGLARMIEEAILWAGDPGAACP